AARCCGRGGSARMVARPHAVVARVLGGPRGRAHLGIPRAHRDQEQIDLHRIAITGTTDMRGTSRCGAFSPGSNTSFTGTRCTTLTKLPVAFSGGSRENTAPEPAWIESTRALNVLPGSGSTVTG